MKPPYEPPAPPATRRSVQERIRRRALIEPLHQVVVDPAGPVLADLVGELLAVAGRAARVDRDHRVARRGEHLVVPAVRATRRARRPAGRRGSEGRRVLLARLPVGRLDDEALHLCASRAGEPEILAPFTASCLTSASFSCVTRAPGAAARAQVGRVHLGGKFRRIARPCDVAAVLRRDECRVVVITDDELRRPA